MDVKLHIGELEFELHLEDASQFSESFQIDLVHAIEQAFDQIQIPPGLELAEIEFLEWDLGEIQSVDQIATRIGFALSNSWNQFHKPEIQPAQTQMVPMVNGVLGLPPKEEEFAEIQNQLVRKTGTAFFSFPGKKISNLEFPVSFFTKIWKQFLRDQAHISQHTLLEALAFFELPQELIQRFKEWAEANAFWLSKTWIQKALQEMSDEDYRNFTYSQLLENVYLHAFKGSILNVLKHTDENALTGDLLTWIALNAPSNQSNTLQLLIQNSIVQENTRTPNRTFDSQREEKRNARTQNRNVDSTQKEDPSVQKIDPKNNQKELEKNTETERSQNNNTKLQNTETELNQNSKAVEHEFWLQEIRIWHSGVNSSALQTLKSHKTLFQAWIRLQEKWGNERDFPFLFWFLNHGLDSVSFEEFRSILLRIQTILSQAVNPKTFDQKQLLLGLETVIPPAIFEKWNSLEGTHQNTPNLAAFWGKFDALFQDQKVQIQALHFALKRESPLKALLNSLNLMDFLQGDIAFSQSAAQAKLWKEIQAFRYFIESNFTQSQLSAAYINLFLKRSFSALIEAWVQLHIWEEKQIAAAERISNNRASETSNKRDSLEPEPDFIESKANDSNTSDNKDIIENQPLLSETTESKTIDSDTSDDKDSIENQPLLSETTESKTIDSDTSDDKDSIENQPLLSETTESKTIDSNTSDFKDSIQSETYYSEQSRKEALKSNIEAVKLYKELQPPFEQWDQATQEAWLEWQNSVQQDEERTRNQFPLIAERISDYLALWNSSTWNPRIFLEENAPFLHNSYLFFVVQLNEGLRYLMRFLTLVIARFPEEFQSHRSLFTQDLPTFQSQVTSLLENTAVRKFPSKYARQWNRVFTLLLNHATAQLYIPNNTTAVINALQTLLIKWQRLHTLLNSTQVDPFYLELNPLPYIPFDSLKFPLLFEERISFSSSADSPIAAATGRIPTTNESTQIPTESSQTSNSQPQTSNPQDPQPQDFLTPEPIAQDSNSQPQTSNPQDPISYFESSMIQGVEIDWVEIDTYLAQLQEKLQKQMPTLSGMPRSKWDLWLNEVRPISLSHWYRIEYLKRKWRELTAQIDISPVKLINFAIDFVEALIQTPQYWLTNNQKDNIDFVEFWKTYLNELIQIRNTQFPNQHSNNPTDWLHFLQQGSILTPQKSIPKEEPTSLSENTTDTYFEIAQNQENQKSADKNLIDPTLTFEWVKIPFSKAIKSAYNWLPLITFESTTPTSLVDLNINISLDYSFVNSLEQLRRDPKKHLWYAELRKNKGKAFDQLAEALNFAEVVDWANQSYSYQWTFTEDHARKLQQFLREEFGIAATFKLTHFLKYRILLIDKPQTRLDMSLLIVEEIFIRVGGLNYAQSQRLIKWLQSVFSLEKLEFSRLEEFFNEKIAAIEPKNLIPLPTVEPTNWEKETQIPTLGTWFAVYIFDHPFLKKEELFAILKNWANDQFPKWESTEKQDTLTVWLDRELNQVASEFRRALLRQSNADSTVLHWLSEHLVVWLTHQKTIPLFEEILQKSHMTWGEVTERLSPQTKRSIAAKVPEIHPVLKQFARDQQIKVEIQKRADSQNPISEIPETIIPLMPVLKPWLNPFTQISAWWQIQLILDPESELSMRQKFHLPLLEIQNLQQLYKEPQLEVDINKILHLLASWALPLRLDVDGSIIVEAPNYDALENWSQTLFADSDTELDGLPEWLIMALIQPRRWMSGWRLHFEDILNELQQRQKSSTTSTTIEIQNQLIFEAFKRFIWEMTSSVNLPNSEGLPYWPLSLAALLETTSPSLTGTSGPSLFENLDSDKSALQTPNSQTPNLQTPNLQTPNPQTPNPQTPNPQTPNPQTPNSQTPNPQTPNPQTPNSQTPNPQTPNPQTQIWREQAAQTIQEIERLRMTRHVFWEENELAFIAIWGHFRAQILRQFTEELKNALPQETVAINNWLEDWLQPVLGNTDDWILNHSLKNMIYWFFQSGWSSDSKFTGVTQILSFLIAPLENALLSESEKLSSHFQSLPVSKSPASLVKDIKPEISQKIEKRIAQEWQETLQPLLDVNILLNPAAVTVFEHPINPGIKLETSPKEAQINKDVKRDIDKGVRFKTQFCGLMMIAPYYATLFKRLQLMEGQQFLSESHQITAYQVLLYITEMDAEILPTEVQDLIPRIITGIAPESELFLEKPLTEETKTEAKRFLTAIKMQWPLMANVSLRGFIESFLLRGGLAWKADDGSWNIEVEGMGSDIIMQTLPWGYATMKFPWTSYLVYTIWKAP